MTYKVDIDKLVDDFNNKGFCHVDLLDHNEAIELLLKYSFNTRNNTPPFPKGVWGIISTHSMKSS